MDGVGDEVVCPRDEAVDIRAGVGASALASAMWRLVCFFCLYQNPFPPSRLRICLFSSASPNRQQYRPCFAALQTVCLRPLVHEITIPEESQLLVTRFSEASADLTLVWIGNNEYLFHCLSFCLTLFHFGRVLLS